MSTAPITPNLIIPGFPKSGTSSLYHYLSQHGEIDGAACKEPHVFTSEERFEQHEDVFEGLFNAHHSCMYRLEASTTYMISPDAPRRIHEVVPDCALIMIARDPIERVFSHYNWLWCNGSVEKDFESEVREWADQEFDPAVHFGGNYKYYISFSAYGEQVERYLSVFDRSQILFLTTEALKNDPREVIDRCFDFLGLQAPSTVDTQRRNVTRAKEITKLPSFLSTARNGLSRIRQVVPQRLVDALPTQKVKSTVKPLFTEMREPRSFGEAEEALVFDLLEPVVDDSQVFVGTFRMYPRMAELNPSAQS